jgi:DDB1- and CUL4-associated factor 5
MSVRFNNAGTHILALRRRLAPVLYAVHSPEPAAEFYHQDYYNSCTMKSCCFAGEGDQYVMSGSDDFNLYMWKIPDGGGSGKCHVII